MLHAAQAAGAGNTPGEVQRMIKELTEPKMNWREILRQQIQSTIKLILHLVVLHVKDGTQVLFFQA